MHAVPCPAAAAALEAEVAHGLSSQQVSDRQRQWGPNALREAPPEPWWRKLAGQFRALVVWILIAAAIVAGASQEWIDMAAILAIVLLNGLLGFFQEERAERALTALQALSAPMAHVLRGGQAATIAARELVPGDLVLLEAGDHVPADARLIESFGLRTQEAALTGESAPVDKSAAAELGAATPLAERQNMVYLGTVVAAGKGRALVAETGMRTELGRIAGLLERQPPEPTPLERRLEELGRVLVLVCGGLVAIVCGLQLVRGGSLGEVFLSAVSLAVAAVPEGLPAVVTVALALGLTRMVRRQALVRKLPSVETLGSVTVICSDKTGTLTRNEMTVRRVYCGGRHYEVTGVGYAPRGEFLRLEPGPGESTDQVPVTPRAVPDLWQTLLAAAHCNGAHLAAPAAEGGGWSIVGDPTEGALLVLAAKGGLDPAAAAGPRLSEIPFDSQRKAMSVVVASAEGRPVMYTKGAPEVVLAWCAEELREGRTVPLDANRRAELRRVGGELASAALRVLAVAVRVDPVQVGGIYREEQLLLAGLVGMVDPPREEVRPAVEQCRRAGIRPVMITGDHPDTAQAIARELGLILPGQRVVDGGQVDAWDEEALTAAVEEVAVYARVSAEHKLRVVQAWKARGQVVAMTGDGVNDAPAVKAADIGIAMGLTGTDVTKAASDMVLMDDNFASIVGAVEEGRGIFDNVQKFVHFLLACNAGEVLAMFAGAAVGWPVPLLPVQLLWINLVTDGLPALALGREPPEPGIMRRPPRPPREPVLTRRRGLLILAHGGLIGAVVVAAFALVYEGGAGGAQRLASARTAAFCVAALGQLGFAFGCRSQQYTLPELGLGSNPLLFVAVWASAGLQVLVVTWEPARAVFGAVPLEAREWGLVVVLSLVPVTVIESLKLLRAVARRLGQAERDTGGR